MNRILLVEDDPNLGTLLKENLENKGLEVTWCTDGEKAITILHAEKFELCVLDVMLPKKDGFAVAREIKKINNNLPFIFLTAKSLTDDRHQGFELGCDDYVTKPFSAYELFLRIKAILKRTGSDDIIENSVAEKINLGEYLFDYSKRMLTFRADARKLSSKEAELLKILSENKNRLITRSAILKAVWGNDDFFASKSMDVYLTKLRRLLKEDMNVEIQNAYGEGYKLIENKVSTSL